MSLLERVEAARQQSAKEGGKTQGTGAPVAGDPTQPATPVAGVPTTPGAPGAAVMSEFRLRGPQTIGEIRTRASRMQALEDLQAAKAVIDALTEQGLVEALTPPGRGQMFAHTLYPPEERQHLNARIEKQAAKAPTPSEAKHVVDQLVERLDAVNERIESLEKRIADLEN